MILLLFNTEIPLYFHCMYIKVLNNTALTYTGFITTLLCESATLVKGKSFVTSYTDFSFKQLMENPLVKEFPLLLKGKCFRDNDIKDFPLAGKAFSINCLKELSVYKVTMDFPLGQL